MDKVLGRALHRGRPIRTDPRRGRRLDRFDRRQLRHRFRACVDVPAVIAPKSCGPKVIHYDDPAALRRLRPRVPDRDDPRPRGAPEVRRRSSSTRPRRWSPSTSTPAGVSAREARRRRCPRTARRSTRSPASFASEPGAAWWSATSSTCRSPATLGVMEDASRRTSRARQDHLPPISEFGMVEMTRRADATEHPQPGTSPCSRTAGRRAVGADSVAADAVVDLGYLVRSTRWPHRTRLRGRGNDPPARRPRGIDADGTRGGWPDLDIRISERDRRRPLRRLRLRRPQRRPRSLTTSQDPQARRRSLPTEIVEADVDRARPPSSGGRRRRRDDARKPAPADVVAIASAGGFEDEDDDEDDEILEDASTAASLQRWILGG